MEKQETDSMWKGCNYKVFTVFEIHSHTPVPDLPYTQTREYHNALIQTFLWIGKAAKFSKEVLEANIYDEGM